MILKYSLYSASRKNVGCLAKFLQQSASYSSSSPSAQVTETGGIKTITMNDIKTRNSLSLDMLDSLLSAVTETSPSTRCVIIRAEGNVFSAGHNLKHIDSDSREGHLSLFRKCSELMLSIRRAEVPIIAQVNGVAAAAGCQLVAACDMAIATHTSTFSTPGAAAGIFCSTPGIPLVRCVPRKVSAYMLLTGRPITAQEALAAGLVSRVVPPHLLEAETDAITESILSKSRAVISLGKKFMYQQMEMTEEEAYECGSCIMVDNINMTDGQEGIKSFVQKRKPTWSHK